MSPCVYTWKEVEHSHTVFLLSVNSERQTMEVHSVVLFVTSNIQKVPPHWLVLSNYQTWKSLCHVPVYC